MGKNRVKGIVVEIGGDTIGLNKALDGTNKKINTTQGNLKDVERLLKLDPTNTKLLEQKQRLLAEAVTQTEEKLQTLNTTNEQVAGSVQNYDAWKSVYDLIQAEIDTTKKKLKELKEQQAKMEDAGEIDTDAYRQLTEEIQTTSEELKSLKKRAEEVTDFFGHPISQEQFDGLQREIAETEQNLRSLRDNAEKNMSQIVAAVDGVSDALENVTESATTFGDVLKAEAFVEGAKGIISSLKDVSEETKEYRIIMSSLEVSSEEAEYSANETEEAYKKLYGVLADDQSAATTLANLQALGLSQSDLLNVIDSAIGGWAKYGDSIPIEGLAESINETAKAGQVTGTFADILNWGAEEGETYGNQLKDLTKLEKLLDSATKDGVEVANIRIRQLQEELGLGDVWGKEIDEMADSQEKQIAKLVALKDAAEDWNQTMSEATTAEDQFNLALQRYSTEQERLNLIMKTMSDQGLDTSGRKWRENNAAMVESNETAADLQEQMATLGEKIEPIITRITKMVVQALAWFNSLDANTQNFILATIAIIAALGPLGIAVSGVSDIIHMLSKMKIPELSKAFDFLTGTTLPSVQGAFSSVFGFIAANPVVLLITAIVGLVALIATKGDEIQDILLRVDDFLQGIFVKDWTQIFGPVLGGILNGFFATVKDIWDSIYLIFNGVIDFIRGVFTGDWTRAWDGVVSIFRGIFDGLEAIAKAPINAIIGLLNGAIDGFNWLIGNLNRLPGVNLSLIGSIPFLANGGEVLRGSAIVGEAGPELLTVMDDRTIVQPLSGNSTSHATYMGGVNLTVYGAPGQDVRELAEIVMEEMQHACGREEEALT